MGGKLPCHSIVSKRKALLWQPDRCSSWSGQSSGWDVKDGREGEGQQGCGGSSRGCSVVARGTLVGGVAPLAGCWSAPTVEAQGGSS